MVKKILKIIFYCVLGFFIFISSSVFIISCYSACSSTSASNDNLVYAEEISSSLDDTFFNILPYPYLYSNYYNEGINYSVNSTNGSISAVGSTGASNSSFILVNSSNLNGLTFEPGSTYYFSCQNSDFAQLVYVDNNNVTRYASTVTWEEGFRFSYLYVGIGYYKVNVNVTLFPVLSKSGNTCFTPPLDLIYGDFYNNGYQNGIQDANLGVLKGMTVDLSLTYEDDYTVSASGLSPNFTYNGFNLDNLASIYENDTTHGVLDSVAVTFNFAMPFEFNAFKFYFLGNSLIETGSIIDVNGVRYPVSFNYEDMVNGVRPIELTSSTDSIISVASLSIPKIGRASDLLYDVGLVISDSSYNLGFDKGYYDGLNDGYQNGLNDNSFYEDGYTKGYNDGFNFASVGQDFSAGSFFRKCLDILDVKIFGFISIGDILKISVGAMLVILALKLFAGG